MSVHNHGPDEGRGLDCPESVIDGELRGACMAERPLFPSYLSPSQINTLLTCGEQFRLERVVRVPQRPMWAGIGGSTVHKVTEILDREWYEDRHQNDPEPG